MATGRIKEMLTSERTSGSDGGLVTIEVFKLGEHLHLDFEMPILTRSMTEYYTLRSQVSNSNCLEKQEIDKYLQNLQFLLSVEHDCWMTRCSPTALRRQVQERQETEKTVKSICHEDDKHFVVNMHALHNATLLRKFLPRNLTAPKPLYHTFQWNFLVPYGPPKLTKTLSTRATQARPRYYCTRVERTGRTDYCTCTTQVGQDCPVGRWT